MMTLFLIFDAIEQGDILLNDEVSVSKKAAQKKGSTMYLREGEKVQLIELIKGIAIVSGNDACVAVAERLYGGEQNFVDNMNRKIKELDLENTRFQTADGWPAVDQYTTAFDMALISKAYLDTHPQALKYHTMPEFSHADIVLHNRNRLILQDPSVDGLKTGHVEEAGYNMIATAQRGDQRFIAVIMGSEDIETREKEALQLLEFGFDYFTIVALFDKGDILASLPVLNGEKTQVGLVPVESGLIRIPVIQKEGIHFEVDTTARLEAPIGENHELGKVRITYGKNVLKTIALVANEVIERKEPPENDEIEPKEPPEKEEKIREGQQAPAEESYSPFAGRHYLVVLFICLLILLLIAQVVYIVKLRKRINQLEASGSEIVKQRLKNIVK